MRENNMKLFKPVRNSKVLFFMLGFLLFGFSVGLCASDEKNNNRQQDLSSQIIAAETEESLYPLFEELKDSYFLEPAMKPEGGPALPAGDSSRYAEFIEFLKSLSAQKQTLEPFTDYYIALTRYHQLKYLEETQTWDEYFAKGNTYRDDITAFANKAIVEVSVSSPLHVYASLVLWQFHKDQEDTLSEQALLNLMQSALDYAKAQNDFIAPIKKAADTLSAYGQKAKAKQLYKVYLDRLVTSETKAEDLNSIALGFYNEGNLDLAENLYDVYVERLKSEADSKEGLVAGLISIARQFSYKDEGRKDPFYAEKIFKEIEAIDAQGAFDKELMYLRGFNLEKIKDYAGAQAIYINLVDLYPESIHAQEAIFKIGVIQTYALRDIEKGKVYFEKLVHFSLPPIDLKPTEEVRGERVSPWVLSSLYQLGLINQWQGDFVKARDYYNQLIEKSGDDFSQIRFLAEARLGEIDGQRPVDYSLRMFLDVSLKEDSPRWNPGHLDLRASAYRTNRDKPLDISTLAYAQESGCMQPQLVYLWSGDLGEAKPTTEDTHFSTKYIHAGTKIINLVVASAAGIIERTFDMVDVD